MKAYRIIRWSLTTMLLPLLLVAAGCVTKRESDARARAAFIAGEKQGAAARLNSKRIWVVGKVSNPNIPWTDELTLSKAIIIAEYLDTGDPQIVLRREGETAQFISAKQMLNGFDMPLEPGDIIELRK